MFSRVTRSSGRGSCLGRDTDYSPIPASRRSFLAISWGLVIPRHGCSSRMANIASTTDRMVPIICAPYSGGASSSMTRPAVSCTTLSISRSISASFSVITLLVWGYLKYVLTEFVEDFDRHSDRATQHTFELVVAIHERPGSLDGMDFHPHSSCFLAFVRDFGLHEEAVFFDYYLRFPGCAQNCGGFSFPTIFDVLLARKDGLFLIDHFTRIEKEIQVAPKSLPFYHVRMGIEHLEQLSMEL